VATDRIVSSKVDRLAPIARHTTAHFVERSGTVLFLGRFPCERDRNDRTVAEQPAADDEVVRAMELEQKQLAGLKRAKLRSTTWLPEIALSTFRAVRNSN
jgi:hypothetical protein